MADTSALHLAISWLPMLLYIAMMVFIIRKMGQINQNIERIAKALEARSDDVGK